MRVARAPAETRVRQRRHSSTQIRAVLASRGTIAQAAAAAGVAVSSAKQWRDGVLPQWFVDEERARAATRATAAAARFVNPEDARAGR